MVDDDGLKAGNTVADDDDDDDDDDAIVAIVDMLLFVCRLLEL